MSDEKTVMQSSKEMGGVVEENTDFVSQKSSSNSHKKQIYLYFFIGAFLINAASIFWTIFYVNRVPTPDPISNTTQYALTIWFRFFETFYLINVFFLSIPFIISCLITVFIHKKSYSNPPGFLYILSGVILHILMFYIFLLAVGLIFAIFLGNFFDIQGAFG